MTRRRSTDYPILGLLCIKNMSGYDLRIEIEGSIHRFWRESEGQIYPTLKSLEAAGEVVKVGDRVNARDRQLYAITGAGRARLRAWVADTPQAQSPRSEFLLKVFLMRYGPKDAVLQHIEDHRLAVEAALAEASALRRNVDRNSAYPDYPVWAALFAHQVLIGEAEIAWCNEALRALRQVNDTLPE